jgi:hypothetical protein
MKTVNLDEDSFWEWMSLGIGIQESGNADFLPKSNNDHVHLLTMMMENHWEGIALNRNTSESSKSAKTLDSLSRHVPRRYLLELQYCLAAYGSVFATLFPSLLSHLDNLPYIEWLLHMEIDNEKYRDHLVHMFRVAFVCNRLMQLPAIAQKIKECQLNSMHFLKWCREKIGTDPIGWENQKKDRLVNAAIYLSAIFHDFGYGYYYLNRYRRRLAGILPSLNQTEAMADIQHREIVCLRNSLAANYVKEYHQAFQTNQSPANEDVILSGFFRDNLGLNHSVASAIFVVDLAGSLLDRHAIGDDLYIAFHLAAEAAMLHDMTENKKWLHFSTGNHKEFLNREKQKEVPIATLLFVADNLELKGRPRIRKKIEDDRCTYSMDDEQKNCKPIIWFDESARCLRTKPSDLITKNDFISDSNNNQLMLFDIPINPKQRQI